MDLKTVYYYIIGVFARMYSESDEGLKGERLSVPSSILDGLIRKFGECDVLNVLRFLEDRKYIEIQFHKENSLDKAKIEVLRPIPKENGKWILPDFLK